MNEAHNIAVIDCDSIIIAMTRTEGEEHVILGSIVLGAADATALASDLLLAIRRHQGREHK